MTPRPVGEIFGNNPDALGGQGAVRPLDVSRSSHDRRTALAAENFRGGE